MSNISYHTIDPYSYKFIIASITNEEEAKELVSKFKIDVGSDKNTYPYPRENGDYH